MSYLEDRFDSCSVAELNYCRVARVEEICEIKQIRKLNLLKDYPHLHASVGPLRMLELKQDIQQIDNILKNLKLSGCHNNRIYKEKIIQ